VTTTIFAALDDSGEPVQLDPSQPFTTWRVLVQTAEDAAVMAAAVGAYAAVEVQHFPPALDVWTSDDRARFGVEVLTIAGAPDGKVRTGLTLAYTQSTDTITASQTFGDAPAEPVPQIVQRVQGRIALLNAGKLAALDAAMASAEEPAREYWASTAIFRRDNPILTASWAAQGGTDAELDALFVAAAEIPL
jgi:hypothetical protein